MEDQDDYPNKDRVEQTTFYINTYTNVMPDKNIQKLSYMGS